MKEVYASKPLIVTPLGLERPMTRASASWNGVGKRRVLEFELSADIVNASVRLLQETG